MLVATTISWLFSELWRCIHYLSAGSRPRTGATRTSTERAAPGALLWDCSRRTRPYSPLLPSGQLEHRGAYRPPQKVSPTRWKFAAPRVPAFGADSPALGLLVMTATHGVSAFSSARSLGFGAAAAGPAMATVSIPVQMASAKRFMTSPLVVVAGPGDVPSSRNGSTPATKWQHARDDDWQVADRRYLSEGSMALLTAPPTEEIDTTDTRQLPAA
jgi:hypothetical protein